LGDLRPEETNRREQLAWSNLAVFHKTLAPAELARIRRSQVLFQPLQVQSADGMSLSRIRRSNA
jgi:hypothetical protein